MSELSLPLRPAQTALLLIDLQNDFIAPDGAYGRAGLGEPAIAALPARLLPVAQALKARGGMVFASRFTLWPDATGEPMIARHLRLLRPFLARGDFAAGSPGQAVVDPLRTLVDISVDKTGFSAFLNTQLDWALRRAGIDTLLIAGIVTQGGVASTVRDAHGRDFHAAVLADGCASLKPEAHATALQDMASVAAISDCASILRHLQ